MDEPVTIWSFEMDNKRKHVLEKRIYPIDSTVYATYHVSGNWKKDKKIGKSYYTIFKYNEYGNLIRREVYDVKYSEKFIHVPTYTETYKYDNYSNIEIITKTSERSRTEVKYQYTFDSFNNWVRRIEYENDVPDIITERKLIYKK
jgi:hypothetical protein